MATARTNPNFRIEIVANLTAHLTHNEQYERLTLTAAEIIDRAQPRIYEVPLDGKEQEIVRANAAPSRVS